MKKFIFFYKELTPAEVGKTGTHEIYIRLPNNFDYYTFFGNTAKENGSVIEVNFIAIDETNGDNDAVKLRFVFFKNSNHEKRIPSLGELFRKHNVQIGDIVCLERREDNSNVSYFIHFYKKTEIKINPSPVYFMRIEDDKNKKQSFNPNNHSLQIIYFGTPGSGKSWTIKQKYEQDETKVFRTTFHPDTDYASFVGCYKPVKDEDDEKKIVYEFVPQAFTDAYVAAWNDLEHPYYLIIEEINRGNCAQIFGDLFQLLDRDKNGYSEYRIKADHDLKDYLVEQLPDDSEGIKDGKLCLPPKLSIIASMNTSDQSLFPMDSAFKRRWSWEYVPIDYENAESSKFEITIGDESHNWHKFLKAVNEKIKNVTSSEDKQMGNFFIKSSIDEKEFCDKVMFYLWSEVGKDNYNTKDAIFKYYVEEDKQKEFSFNELYDLSKRTEILKGFIRYIEEEK